MNQFEELMEQISHLTAVELLARKSIAFRDRTTTEYLNARLASGLPAFVQGWWK